MLSRTLALDLRAAGVRWTPAKGDRFLVPDSDLDDQVFVLSDMVIQLIELSGGSSILAFNGTTEWALDSLEADRALWLPREDQLRDLLGDAFVGLERLEGAAGGWAVTVAFGGTPSRHVDADVDSAYARAVLATRRPPRPAGTP